VLFYTFDWFPAGFRRRFEKVHGLLWPIIKEIVKQ
jgi:hypothetical protein